MFEGSQTRVLYWNVLNSTCSNNQVEYSHSFRYETGRKEIQQFQKGAHHVKGVFAALALAPNELLVSDTEFFEGFGRYEYLTDVFYVKYDDDATVDHCDSLTDCDVPLPEKRHVIRRHHDYELSGITWGPIVEKDGMNHSTLVMSFEDDDLVGVLMEQYIFDPEKLALEPLWENNISSDDFLIKRYVAVGIGMALFLLGILLQHYWLHRKKIQSNGGNNQTVDTSRQQDSTVEEPVTKFCGIDYRTYIIASATLNSCLLGGVVFGYPGLVLILRQEGVYAENCSCGTFCSGQQEQFAMLSTIGFAVGIGSRLFGGIFLDKFGPKITSTLAGLLCFSAFLLLATAQDSEQLSQVVQTAWVVLALGGATIHLTSFHTTNLQRDKASKGQASVYISAGFGGGSLVLPVLQLINQYCGISLQVISTCYSGLALLLTFNCFFHQPWRAWNAIGSNATLDINIFRKHWWPTFAADGPLSFRRLSASKQASDPKYPSLKKALRSFQFWGECYWFSCSVFLLTYYLSTISQLLYSLGDAKVNDDVNSFANNIYTRLAIFVNGMGFLFAPIVAYLQKTRTIYFRICLEVGMAFVSCVLLTIPVLELQIATFILQSFVRLQMFAYHFSYLQNRFGFRHFGILNGISSLVAGVFGLGGYGLQIFSIYVMDGSFVVSYVIVGALILSTLFFPFILKRIETEIQETPETKKQETLEVKESEQVSNKDLQTTYNEREQETPEANYPEQASGENN